MEFVNIVRYAKGLFSDGLYIFGAAFLNFIPGNEAQATGTAIAVVVLLATLMIGALIFAKMYGQVDAEINASVDPDAQTALDNIKDTGWSSLNMLVIAAFVAAAVVILAILIRLGGGGGYA